MNRFPPPFESYVAPARARAELWRTGVGVCLILAIYSGLTFGALWAADVLWFDFDLDGLAPGSTLFLLFTFLGMAIAPLVVVPMLHGRRAGSLFGRAAWVLRDFAVTLAVVVPLFALSFAMWSLWFDPVPGLGLDQWLRLLPLALVGVLIQTGAEELVFRGYLQQQLAARFASPLAWAVVPSLLFGAAHADAGSLGPNLWPVIGATAAFGLIAADLTARTGSLGAAWGLHFINNVFALLIIGLAGPLSGLALFQTPYGAEDPKLAWLLVIDVLVLGLAWLLLRRMVLR